mmetsp:Transcript_22567/g.53274  ORF Transcript_22567/g.53274 Transcript_22567/m.53274 type:complete len:84 (-) Transcript_22567:118-369(-)
MTSTPKYPSSRIDLKSSGDMGSSIPQRVLISFNSGFVDSDGSIFGFHRSKAFCVRQIGLLLERIKAIESRGIVNPIHDQQVAS